MNDQTPRKYRGSLLERASAHYPFAPQAHPIPPLPPRNEPVPPMPAFEPEEPVRGDNTPAASDPFFSDPSPVLSDSFFNEPAPSVQEPAFSDAAPEPLELLEPVLLEPTPFALSEPAEIFESPARSPEMESRRSIAIDRDWLAEKGLLVPGSAITPLAEEFRMIKRQLLLTSRAISAAQTSQSDRRARMVLVCSAQPGDGKTFCAVNLAISMAQERDVEVLLVDADFAKPSIPDRLGAPKGPGLLDALTGAVDSVEECILDTDIPQLSILPAGTRTHSDTELLASERARAMLEALTAAHPRRIVIFDSPPALAASPASVLALHVGQVMLVVRADRTSEGDLREAVKQLDSCEHIHLVLNSVSFQSGRNRFGTYYGEAGE